jgi:S1-C subfamily serine protease
LLKRLIISTFLGLLALGGLSLYASPVAGTVDNDDFPSMVLIEAVIPALGDREETSGHGSGAILDPWHVLTAKHVVEKAAMNAGTMRVIDNTGQIREVVHVSMDPKKDVAVVTVKQPFKQKPVVVSCKAVEPLERLFVVGYPLGFGRMVFEVTVGKYMTDDTQTILAVTGVSLPGNSGGPVFTRSGELVGILVGEFMTENVVAVDVVIPQDTDVNVVVPTIAMKLCDNEVS